MQAGEKAYDIAADHVLSAGSPLRQLYQGGAGLLCVPDGHQPPDQRLEEELHVTLLERDTAHVKLTLAGEYFFQQVNELTARLEEVVTEPRPSPRSSRPT